MRTLLQMLIVKGVFLLALGVYIACHAVDPATWLTVNPAMMNIATIVSLIGILIAFGSWIVLDHAMLEGD